MQKLYTVLLNLLLPFILLRLLWRGIKQSAYHKRWRERFGYVDILLTDKFLGSGAVSPEHFGFSLIRQASKPAEFASVNEHGELRRQQSRKSKGDGYNKLDQSIWIHAVSLGEVNAAIPLVHVLRKCYPAIPIVMTTTTPTGSAQVLRQLKGKVMHFYAPIDLPRFINRFLKSIRPKICILMETEIWPNILKCCEQKKIPVCMANARLSERSFKGYSHIKKFMQKLFWSIDFVGAQTKEDAMRFLNLGLSKDKVKVLGNLKFDMKIPEAVFQKADLLKEQLKERSVFVAASTHAGEEEIILTAFQKVLVQHKNALLILIPRHPERFNTVADLLKKKRFQFVRRSQMAQEILPEIQVLLGDTMGEVLLFYACANVAFVGGSLVSTGGHNLLEPAAFSLPILSGPNLSNFVFIRDALQAAKALSIIHNENELSEYVLNHFNDTALAYQMGARAYQVFESNQGVCENYLNWIRKIMATKLATH